jgi:hypothetical protein
LAGLHRVRLAHGWRAREEAGGDEPVGCVNSICPKTAGSDNECEWRPPRVEAKLRWPTKAGRRPFGGSATTAPFLDHLPARLPNLNRRCASATRLRCHGLPGRKAPDRRVQVVRTINLSVFRGYSSATTGIVDEPMIPTDRHP